MYLKFQRIDFTREKSTFSYELCNREETCRRSHGSSIQDHASAIRFEYHYRSSLRTRDWRTIEYRM